MNKRDKFIAELREEARNRSLSLRIEYRRGKGGHAMVWVGECFTTLPSREIDPHTGAENQKEAWAR